MGGCPRGKAGWSATGFPLRDAEHQQRARRRVVPRPTIGHRSSHAKAIVGPNRCSRALSWPSTRERCSGPTIPLLQKDSSRRGPVLDGSDHPVEGAHRVDLRRGQRLRADSRDRRHAGTRRVVRFLPRRGVREVFTSASHFPRKRGTRPGLGRMPAAWREQVSGAERPAGEDVHKGRLARARWARGRCQAALVDLKRDAAQCVDLGGRPSPSPWDFCAPIRPRATLLQRGARPGRRTAVGRMFEVAPLGAVDMPRSWAYPRLLPIGGDPNSPPNLSRRSGLRWAGGSWRNPLSSSRKPRRACRGCAASSRRKARPLLEREAELVALQALVESARSGDGRLVVIEGAAGIGKTRLAARHAR